MERMRYGWRCLAAAAGIALLVLLGGCSSAVLSLAYDLATTLIGSLATGTTTGA